MHLKPTIFVYLLVLISLEVSKINGLRCYICGEEDDTHNGNSNNTCQNFETSKDGFIRECDPSENQACESALLDGKVVKRACIKTMSNQCIPLNNLVYCFCTTDLCNGNVTPKFLSPTDDEDLLEGSGIRTVSIATETPKITHKINSTGAVIKVSLVIILVSIVIFTITK